MYLYSRQRRIAPGIPINDGQEWAKNVATAVQGTGLATVSIFRREFSPDVGTLAFLIQPEDIMSLQTLFEKLGDESTYQQLVSQGEESLVGHPQDHLMSVLSGTLPNLADTNVDYLVTTQAVFGMGQQQQAQLLGKQIAEQITDYTDHPTAFLVNETGRYGGSLWITCYENAQAMQAGLTELQQRQAWREWLQSNTQPFVDGEGVTRTLIQHKIPH